MPEQGRFSIVVYILYKSGKMSEPDKSSRKEGTRRRRTNRRGADASERKGGGAADDAEKSSDKPERAMREESADRSTDSRGDRNRRSEGRDRDAGIVEEQEEGETNPNVDGEEDGERPGRARFHAAPVVGLSADARR